MSATGDAVTFACRALPVLMRLGRPVLLRLKRVAERQAARAKTMLDDLPVSAPEHRVVAAQARVRRAAESVTKYSEALRCLEMSGTSASSR